MSDSGPDHYRIAGHQQAFSHLGCHIRSLVPGRSLKPEMPNPRNGSRRTTFTDTIREALASHPSKGSAIPRAMGQRQETVIFLACI
jgi:hypothetical protein